MDQPGASIIKDQMKGISSTIVLIDHAATQK